MKKTVLFALTFGLLTFISKAQDGILDNSFGTSGIVVTDINSNADMARNVIVQPDGKIVIGGNTNNGNGEDYALIRYNSNGTLDNTFGTGGKVITHVTDGDDVVRGMAIQPDGKIVVVGYAGVSNEFSSLVRYNSNGTLDNTFATNGMDSLTINNERTTPNDVQLQPDGKIVVGGFYTSGGYDAPFIARYNQNGTLDSGFGIGGITTAALGFADVIIEDIKIQADGKIVAVGSFDSGSGTTILVARFGSFGGLDNSFGTNGVVNTIVGLNSSAWSVALQSDGSIIVGGYSADALGVDIIVLKYLSNGTLDNTFNSVGYVTKDLGGNVTDFLTQLIVQPNNKIIVSGVSFFPSSIDYAILRYNSNGTLDNTFGTSGIVNANSSTTNTISFSITTQSDGKIIVVGTADDDVYLARYTNTDIVGISENNFNNSISIYPNPSKGHTLLSLDNNLTNFKLSIIDITGKEVYFMNDIKTDKVNVNISHLSNGIYFIKVMADNKQEVIKLIKE